MCATFQFLRSCANYHPKVMDDADCYGNDASVEAMWAMKAFEHAHVYLNLVRSIPTGSRPSLRLTPQDDAIYEAFVQQFPDFELGHILVDEQLKGEAAKLKWRPFCNQFEGKVEDFNFGTLLRIDADGDYSEENTILVTRIQFYAIEIARNRTGRNGLLQAIVSTTTTSPEGHDDEATDHQASS